MSGPDSQPTALPNENDLAIPRGMAFDPECLKLAQYFCPHAPIQLLYRLVENSDASTAEEKYLGT